MTVIGTLSGFGKAISTVWANGSRLLWSVAVACGAAAVVLRLGIYLGLRNAQLWWDEYGLALILACAVVAVFAGFKSRAERRDTGVFLVADEQMSHWGHAKQTNGSVVTAFSLHFHATASKRAVHLLKVRLQRPWIGRWRYYTTSVMTWTPLDEECDSVYVPFRARRQFQADIAVDGEVGGTGRTNPMSLTIEVQDNFGRWHKLSFRDVRGSGVVEGVIAPPRNTTRV